MEGGCDDNAKAGELSELDTENTGSNATAIDKGFRSDYLGEVKLTCGTVLGPVYYQTQFLLTCPVKCDELPPCRWMPPA